MKRCSLCYIVLLLAAFVSLLPLQAEAAETWTLKGRITDTNGVPLYQNVYVNFRYDDGSQQPPGGSIMNDQGYFQLQLALGKPGTLVISGKTFLTLEDHFSARNSPTEENWNYTLHHDYWTLQGNLTEYLSGSPIAGMKVHFSLDKNGTTAAVGQTDSNGHFSMRLPVNESGTLYADRFHTPGWLPFSDHFSARGSERDETWNYKLSHPFWTLKGQVTDAQGKPVYSAYVQFRYDPGQNANFEFDNPTRKHQPHGYTDAHGFFTIYPLLSRSGTLVISAPHWQTKEDHFSARGSEREETWNYTLQRQ